MDDWAWEHVARWTEHRIQLPVGLLFCILAGPTRGRAWSATAARGELRRLAEQAGVRRRFAPHHYGMLTRSRWPTRGSRGRSSSASSGMRTLGSRRSTSKGFGQTLSFAETTLKKVLEADGLLEGGDVLSLTESGSQEIGDADYPSPGPVW